MSDTNGKYPVGVVVPDASVAAKWYLDDEDDVELARALYRQFERDELILAVPDCFYYELAGVMRTAERRTRLGAGEADAALDAIAALQFYTFTSRFYLRDAAMRSRSFDISLYDALYLSVADAIGAVFVTADGRLFERLEHLTNVRPLRGPEL